jgi:hypothetical protein
LQKYHHIPARPYAKLAGPRFKGKEEMMTDQPILKCPKCAAILMPEGYHQYGWYLDGERVEGCPTEAQYIRVRRGDLRSLLAALGSAQPFLVPPEIYQRLQAALQE